MMFKKNSLIVISILTLLSCNKEKRFSNTLIKGEVWKVENIIIGEEESQIHGDWEVLQNISIYDSVPTVIWRNSEFDAVFDWQFKNNGKAFMLKYHLLCAEISEDELDTLDFLVYDLSGIYEVDKKGKNKMTFASRNTQSYSDKNVKITIEKK